MYIPVLQAEVSSGGNFGSQGTFGKFGNIDDCQHWGRWYQHLVDRVAVDAAK